MKNLLFCVVLFMMLASSSCVRLRWYHETFDQPIALSTYSHLREGQSNLTDCLAALGAPHWVRDYREEGVAVAYAWLDKTTLGFTASANFFRLAPAASFSFDNDDIEWPGIVLFFDSDLTLTEIRRGMLDDIRLPNERKRPSLVE